MPNNDHPYRNNSIEEVSVKSFSVDKIYDEFSELIPKEKKQLKSAEQYAINCMDQDDVHGIGHVLRVIGNLRRIIIAEGGNPFILFFSAWLHDIGRYKLDENNNKINNYKINNHAVLSAKLTEEFVLREKLKIPVEDLNKIIECIESHSFSSGKTQETLEAKIFSDADKLDALGSVGIYRASCFQHENGTGLDGLIRHFNEKLLNLHIKFHTKTGKKLATQYCSFMGEYIGLLRKELRIP
ncbi:MAG: HD domain-containing protein [Promethearchaeota archaeon]